MKRHIFDLLDSIPGDTVQLEESAPLSSERIRKLTMERISPKEKKKPRILYRIFITAAILSLLSATAFGAEPFLEAGDWFRSVLNHLLEQDKEIVQNMGLDVTVPETITPEQIQLVNDLGKVFEQTSVTSEGTTVTLTAAYADANVMHLYFQVEAPKGTVLPDGINYTFQDTGDVEPFLELSENGGCAYKVEALPDENPKDNRKEFHVTARLVPGNDAKLNDDTPKKVAISGIYGWMPTDNGVECTCLAPGEFSFDIRVVNSAKEIALDVEGITYGGHKEHTWTHEGDCTDWCRKKLTGQKDPENGLPTHFDSYDFTITVKEMKIGPLGVEWACSYTCSEDEPFAFDLDFQIIMKDGGSPLCSKITIENERFTQGSGSFTTPLDLNQVDYILIGDPELGEPVKVFLPQ